MSSNVLTIQDRTYTTTQPPNPTSYTVYIYFSAQPSWGGLQS